MEKNEVNGSFHAHKVSMLSFDPSILTIPALLMFLVAVISLIGNSLLIYANIRNKDICHEQLVIPVLAFVDGCQALGVIGFSLAPLVPVYAFTKQQCACILSLTAFPFIATPVYTLVLSILRLIGFRMPVFYVRLRARQFVVVLHACTITLAAHFPIYLIWKSSSEVRVPLCLLAHLDIRPSPLVAPTLLIVILSTGIVNGVLLAVIWKRKNSSVSSTLAAKRDLKFANSILIVSSIYLISLIASVLSILVLRNMGLEPGTDVAVNFSTVLLFPILNGASNYFVYVSRSKEYMEMIFPRFCRKMVVKIRTIQVTPLANETPMNRSIAIERMKTNA